MCDKSTLSQAFDEAPTEEVKSMVTVVFRTRLNPGYDEELERLGKDLYELASMMPGFISYVEYSSAAGEGVSIVEFESHEALRAWREHPEHKKAQSAGRKRYFSSYRI